MDIEISKVSTATFIGLFLSSISLGIGFSSGVMTIDALLLTQSKAANETKDTAASKESNLGVVTTPGHLARQWKCVWDYGHKTGPFTTILTTILWLYAAYYLPAGRTNARILYIVGACFVIALPIFTVVFIQSTNNKLNERAAAAESGKKPNRVDEPPTIQLITEWRQLHMIRTCFPIIGMACVVAANVK